MEEDSVVKAPVTRLRRRLSVETEDVKSPVGPSTPSKKRGGRLAAKPQLELINENATESAPKRSTRKSIVKDIVEPVEEKPATPSRRSARIKSNTSIVSDTAQVIDSPRAKRIARRNSQIGSDNEAPSTPIRATRRTRKDSTSSMDKQAETTANNKIEPITQVIPEEVEIDNKEDSIESTKANTSVRKSPRLTKNDRRRSSIKKGLDSNDEQKQDQQATFSENKSSPLIENRKVHEKTPEPKNNLSLTSTNLLNNLETKSKKALSAFNKSTSALEVQNNSKSKRSRTKSWTILTKESSSVNDEIFFSDNESVKKNRSNKSGSGDNVFNISVKNGTNENSMTKKSLSISIQESTENPSILDAKVSTDMEQSEKSRNLEKSYSETPKPVDSSNERNKEYISSFNVDKTKNLGSSARLFENAPTGEIQSLIFIEDSDSNTGSVGKTGEAIHFHSEDQCVPVVDNPLDNKKVKDDSCEPMDIDITIPGNKTTELSENKNSTPFKINSSRRKSSLSLAPENADIANKSTNKSSRKSSTSQKESQNLEKSSNESKSTLILSQIKDNSMNDVSISMSPKVTKNESLHSSKLRDTEKKIASVTYQTSTPLQQKPLKNLIQMNTSIISSQENANTQEIKKKSKVDNSQMNELSGESSDVEFDEGTESREKNEILDDEAEEASDDYESGDSRDEEERQYEEDNEIRERGETLDTEEDVSTDSDYEKDSFVVSSDEDDNDLLSGSGDDLSMSDKDLSMSAKSKKKYNERKEKERKKASKEMYEARHNIKKTDSTSKFDTSKPKKLNRQRLDSTVSDSDNDANIQPKKSKRLRIDSSQDISITVESDDDEDSTPKNKNESRRLSESLNNKNALAETEITINNQSYLDKEDPLSVQLKKESKTPQKDDSEHSSDVEEVKEVEEVHVNENRSILKTNETSDPLQATMIDNESFSSSDDNNEIIENFDSMLNDLNNDVKKKRAKLWDTSLNLEKKPKPKPKELIVEQLNLTLTKHTKKMKSVKDTKEKSQDKSIIQSASNICHEENSSDSIDMRLLFPEDSNDSETVRQNENVTPKNDIEDFIPLKRIDAKTDITESKNTSANDEDTLNVSVNKKKKKRKSSVCPPEDLAAKDEEKDEVNLTVGTMDTGSNSNASANVSLKNSSKKKKNKQSISFVHDAELDNNDTSKVNEDALNMSKKKNKKKSLSQSEEAATANVAEKDEVSFIVDTTGTELNLNTSANASLKDSSKKKKKNSISFVNDAGDDKIDEPKGNTNDLKTSSKKRKRKSSAELPGDDDNKLMNTSLALNNSVTTEKQNKKRKISRNEDHTPQQISEDTSESQQHQAQSQHTESQRKAQIAAPETVEEIGKRNKKRKRKDNDDVKTSKVLKQNSFDDIHVPRLPASLISQLDEKPKTENLLKKKSQVISTTQFIVEESKGSKQKKNKPSNYLEESVYLSDSPVAKKQKSSLINPKVLPFIPTASTSNTGFTTNFRVNPMPRETKFTAQSNDMSNFKNDYLLNRRVKKMGTYEMYKRRRNIKLSKF